MKKPFVLSLIAGLTPIVILTTIALTQLEPWGYYELGRIIVFVQAGYVILLIPTTITFFILRRRDIALGLLVSFGIGFFVALIALGMGL